MICIWKSKKVSVTQNKQLLKSHFCLYYRVCTHTRVWVCVWLRVAVGSGRYLSAYACDSIYIPWESDSCDLSLWVHARSLTANTGEAALWGVLELMTWTWWKQAKWMVWSIDEGRDQEKTWRWDKPHHGGTTGLGKQKQEAYWCRKRLYHKR